MTDGGITDDELAEPSAALTGEQIRIAVEALSSVAAEAGVTTPRPASPAGEDLDPLHPRRLWPS